MNTGTKAALAAIVIVMPLSGYALWTSEQNKEQLQNPGQHKILVTFYPLYQFAKAVGGDKVDVSIIIPPGIEPHEWEPTIQDIEKFKTANLVIINGAGLEPWISKLTGTNPEMIVLDTSKNIKLLRKDAPNQTDPHIWLDPVLAKTQIQNIADGLEKSDPQNADYYQQNANQYKSKLASLDSTIRTELSNCSKKDFLAFHDAFSYFAIEYGLHQNTIVGGLNPEAEPTATTLEQITQKSRNLGLQVVFTEEAVNPQIAKVIADEIHGKVLVLSPLEVTSINNDYVDEMKKNLSNLREALCQ